MYEPSYQGLPVITVQTRRGQKNVVDELVEYEMDLDDVVAILNEGYECSRSKRRKGVLEKCVDRGDKTVKVVVQRGFIELDGRECWELIHVGKFTRR
ncbi:hypothetical protein HYU07_01320 [Candidatus Woesearchaeota archaeon]|nr:hypothetical protein [Candidatus Woesearchaeota archaeon]